MQKLVVRARRHHEDDNATRIYLINSIRYKVTETQSAGLWSIFGSSVYFVYLSATFEAPNENGLIVA